jgi:hypothetical protein
MVIYCPPPPTTTEVIFEERVSNVRRSISGVQIAGTQSVALPLTEHAIPMAAVHTSLKKKFRQERMTNFEREYHW